MMGWTGVYSQPGRTLLARDELAKAGLGAFCPVERIKRRHKIANRNSYKLETITAPIFGRYLFAQGEVGEVLQVRGVSDVIRRGVEPVSVPERVIDAMLDMTGWVDGVGHLMGSRDISRMKHGLKGRVGDAFRFAGGPFAGFIGVISSLDGLDKRGEIRAYVDLLSGRRELTVKHGVVGALIKQAPGSVGELIAA